MIFLFESLMRIIPVNTLKDQEIIKYKVLQTAKSIIPFRGCNNSMLEEASLQAGYDEKLVHLIMPGGVNELLDCYLAELDEKMLTDVLPRCHNLKIREKVYEALKIRIEIMTRQKGLTIKTFTYLSLPWNIGLTAKFAWRTVDLIWREICNDSSTDFNYYTKRSLLYAVYKSTLLYWLSDDSDENRDTYDFLIRRINDVLKVGGLIAKFKSPN